MHKALIAAALAYGAIGILTFGYSAANAACDYGESRISRSFQTDCQASSGMVAAVVWPLYWSWEAFAAPHPSTPTGER
jgi:hypothetical protein